MSSVGNGLYSGGLQALMRKPEPPIIVGESIEETIARTKELERETRIAWWAIGGILTFAILFDLARSGHISWRHPWSKS